MKKKILVILEQQDLLQLKAILIDKDKEEAYEFIEKNLVPKINKEADCLKFSNDRK